MYKLPALVSLTFTDTATDSKFSGEKESQIIDFGAEGALRDPNPSPYKWEN